jgi:hypothetical protein
MAIPVITVPGPLAERGRIVPSTLPGLTPNIVHFTADQNVTWTIDGGILGGVTVNAVDWTFPNQSGTFHLHGENAGHEIGTVTAVIEAYVPNYWEFANQLDVIKKLLEFEPLDGPTQHRIFTSASQHKWELGADDSSQTEYLEMRAFWEYHHPGKQFLLWDPVINEIRRYETDSDWSGVYKPGDSYSWKFKIKEVWNYAIVT